MNVSICRLTLRLPENQSLKGKRRVISSLSSRIHNKFNVSIAEVDHNEAWQLATIGIACVSNSSRHSDGVLASVLSFIESSREDLEVVSQERESLSGL